MNRKKIIIIAAISLLVIGGVGYFAYNASQTPPQEQQVEQNTDSDSLSGGAKNRDTGEPLDTRYVDLLESMDGSREYHTRIFGVTDLSAVLAKKINEVAAIAEYRSPLIVDISTALALYGDGELEKKYDILTILPDSINVEGTSKITANVRLGESDTILPVSVKILSTPFKGFIPNQSIRQGEVTIGTGDTAFHYLGGLGESVNNSATIIQTDFKDPAITVSATNKEAALKYLKDIGYNIPDIRISFSDYRSIFE